MIGHLLAVLGLAALLLPVLGGLGLGLARLFDLPLTERAVHRVSASVFGGALASCLGVDLLVLLGERSTVTLARWLVLPDYAIEASLVFDPAAAVLMTLTALLCGLIGAFSAPYLHQDPGYRRFYILLCLFGAGMMAIGSGATLDLIYAGWEVVGLSSALLIAYFTGREAPVRHGLRAFAVYRLCDVGLLSAAILLHHEAGEAALSHGAVAGPAGLAIAALLVFASMGKAAAFPFTGWLPRAMEGPTPSSAIFYGALSIHAGPFLLIRAWPLLEGQPAARAALVAIGLVTALHATLVGRVQTDIKCALGYASVTQAGLILAEIGLGLPQLALVHLAGHAVLRTWQLLRAPSMLHDRHQLVGLLGGGRPPRGTHWERLLPGPVRRFAYRLSLERWFLDDVALTWLLAPAAAILRALDGLDRRWSVAMGGGELEPTAPDPGEIR